MADSLQGGAPKRVSKQSLQRTWYFRTYYLLLGRSGCWSWGCLESGGNGMTSYCQQQSFKQICPSAGDQNSNGRDPSKSPSLQRNKGRSRNTVPKQCLARINRAIILLPNLHRPPSNRPFKIPSYHLIYLLISLRKRAP